MASEGTVERLFLGGLAHGETFRMDAGAYAWKVAKPGKGIQVYRAVRIVNPDRDAIRWVMVAGGAATSDPYQVLVEYLVGRWVSEAPDDHR